VRAIVLALVPAACVLTSTVLADVTGERAADTGSAWADDALPGERLRTHMVRRYTMSGRIRPLLFWFGRDNIGLARVVWRRDEQGARGYELLVGTDPARAPRSLNRWGYVAEEASGPDGALLAMMTGADELSYEEAEASSARSSSTGDFRAIRAEVRGSDASWHVARVETPRAFTIHDVGAALDRVRRETATSDPRARRVPPHARPGFLVALADLLEEIARVARHQSTAEVLRRVRVPYLFGQHTYELRVRDLHPGLMQLRGQPTSILQSSFEVRTLATDARTRFEIASGTQGDLAGVPVAMEWQPRWWLKVELRLDESDPAASSR
jgi:hypothetical protein